MKRLRKKTGYAHKYYCVGEYGSKFQRPHYHAIIFGATEREIHQAWEGYRDGDVINGNALCGAVTSSSIAYCAKYVDKGKVIPMFKGDDRMPEYSQMSNNIGKNYLTPAMESYYRNTLSPFAILDGQKVPLPRYYKERIFDSEQRGKMNEEFAKKNKQIYDQQITAAGSEEMYIQNLNAQIWQNHLSELQLRKEKRQKF